MVTRLLLVLFCAVISCSPSPSCYNEGGVCEGGEGSSSWLGPDRLLHRISQECQDNVIKSSAGIFISVKTTSKYHSTRLPPILFTWLQNILPDQVHLVTDREANGNDIWLNQAKENGFNVIHADCDIGHGRENLCCKSGAEFQNYYNRKHGYRWYCHFDDDMYVNIPALFSSLANHDPLQQRVYIGRWPLAAKELSVPAHFHEMFPSSAGDTYQYATGAAFCISSSLMAELEEYLSGPTQFMSACNHLRRPDDMLVGCVIVAVLGYNLTNDLAFSSHLNSMRISQHKLKDQSMQKINGMFVVPWGCPETWCPLTTLSRSNCPYPYRNIKVTVSYGTWTAKRGDEMVMTHNRMEILNAVFTTDEDPTRFFSYHCLLYPETRWCN